MSWFQINKYKHNIKIYTSWYDCTLPMMKESDLALIRMQVGLERQNFWIAAASLSEKVETGEMFNVSHPSCMHLYEVFYPSGLILWALRWKLKRKKVRLKIFQWRLSKWSVGSKCTDDPYILQHTEPMPVAPSWPRSVPLLQSCVECARKTCPWLSTSSPAISCTE